MAKAIAATWLPAGATVMAVDAPWREHLETALFRTGPVLLGLALLGLQARLANGGRRGRGVGSAGAVAAWAAVLATVVSLAALAANVLSPGTSKGLLQGSGFVAFVSLFLGVTLLGAACVVTNALGRWSGLPLAIALLGPLTILAAPVLRRAGHSWAFVDLPVLLLGGGWILLGVVLVRGGYRPAGKSAGSS